MRQVDTQEGVIQPPVPLVRDWSSLVAYLFKFISVLAFVGTVYYGFKIERSLKPIGSSSLVNYVTIAEVAIGSFVSLVLFALGHAFSMLNAIYDRQAGIPIPSETSESPSPLISRATHPTQQHDGSNASWPLGTEEERVPTPSVDFEQGANSTRAHSSGGLRAALAKERHLFKKHDQ